MVLSSVYGVLSKIALKCLGCAACTYVCPTCHCFDMQDETAGTRGARIRVWDSCMHDIVYPFSIMRWAATGESIPPELRATPLIGIQVLGNS